MKLMEHLARIRRHSCHHPHHEDCVCWDAGGGPKPRLNQLNICTNSSHFLSLVSSYSAKLGCSQCSGGLWTSVYLHPRIHTSLLIHHPNTITDDSIQQNLISWKMKLRQFNLLYFHLIWIQKLNSAVFNSPLKSLLLKLLTIHPSSHENMD